MHPVVGGLRGDRIAGRGGAALVRPGAAVLAVLPLVTEPRTGGCNGEGRGLAGSHALIRRLGGDDHRFDQFFDRLVLPAQFLTAALTVNHFVIAAFGFRRGRDLIFPHRLAGSVGQLINRLCRTAQLFPAYRAVRYLVVASLCCAGRRYFLLPHRIAGSMGQLINRLCRTAQFLVAYRAVRYFVVASRCRAGRRYFVLPHRFAGSVGQLVDRLRLSAQFLMAHRAVRYFVVASRCRAGCRYFLLPHRLTGGMGQLVDRLRLSAQFLMAHRAVRYFVVASRCRAGCCYFLLPHRFAGSVGQLVDRLCRTAQLFPADHAVRYLVIAPLCRAGCSFFVLPHRIARGMARGRDLLGLLICVRLAAESHGGSIDLRPGLSAGSLFRAHGDRGADGLGIAAAFTGEDRHGGSVVRHPGPFRLSVIMGQLGDLLGLRLLLKGGILKDRRVFHLSRCGAGGRSLDAAGGLDHLRLHMAWVVSADPSRRYAGIVLSPDVLHRAPVMAHRRDGLLFPAQLLAAYGTVRYLVITPRCGTGRRHLFLAHDLAGGMSQSRNRFCLLIGIDLAAELHGSGINRLSSFGTGGIDADACDRRLHSPDISALPAGEERKRGIISVRPGPDRFAVAVGQLGDLFRLRLSLKGGILECRRIFRLSRCRAGGWDLDASGGPDRLRLHMVRIVGAGPRRRHAAVVRRPFVVHRAPGMPCGRNLLGLRLLLKGGILKDCRIFRLSRCRAGGWDLDASGGLDRLRLHMARIVGAGPRRRHAAVVCGPDVVHRAPGMPCGRNLLGLRLLLKGGILKDCRIFRLSRCRAGGWDLDASGGLDRLRLHMARIVGAGPRRRHAAVVRTPDVVYRTPGMACGRDLHDLLIRTGIATKGDGCRIDDLPS